MNNIITLDGKISSIKIQPETELVIIESNDKDRVLVESENIEDLEFNTSFNEISLQHKNQPSVGQIVDAFSDLFFKRDASGFEQIATPSIKTKVTLYTSSKNLSIRINNGILTVDKDLESLDLRSNNLIGFSSKKVENLEMRVNYGDICLDYHEGIRQWMLKINKGSLVIKQNGYTYPYSARINNSRYNKNQAGVIDIRINHGSLRFE